MRILILLYTFFHFSNSFAQAPAVLQWQKSYGGSGFDYVDDMKMLSDGSFIVLGTSNSIDGDIITQHDPIYGGDIFVLKFNPVGNLLWTRTYGGLVTEAGSSIIATSDGGCIFIGKTYSNDGDVSGNHGPIGITADVWVVKLDANGNIQWQRCYGGSKVDVGKDIIEVSGGYIFTAGTESVDGDVSGNHGLYDLWIVRIDVTGNIIWQRCYGGSKGEASSGVPDAVTDFIRQAPDGNFIIATDTQSNDGDVTGFNNTHVQDLWIFKINGTGAIIWDKCYGGTLGDKAAAPVVNNDGSIFLTGLTFSKDLPGAIPNPPGTSSLTHLDALALKLDAGGNLLWIKAFGGSDKDAIVDAIRSPDGGYVLTGTTRSKDIIVCQKHLMEEVWFVKMDANGNIQWNRTFGGDRTDYAVRMAFTSSGECLVAGYSFSSDGDVSSNKGFSDVWLSRYEFTGPLIYPTVGISSGTDSIVCSGNSVQFLAKPVNGGNKPIYQWHLNGVNVGSGSDTLYLSNLQNNDSVSCTMISNSPCVDTKTVHSNTIKVKVGPRRPPSLFLPVDTALCSYQKIKLTTRGKFNSYLWKDNTTDESITVRQPGIYWLEVSDRYGCIGRDSIIISAKPCIEGIYIPNAFTPNKDGKNDLFMPFMYAAVEQYRFMVYDRWGRVVFQTTTLNKGWDGKVNGLPYDTGVFVWQVIYQLEGEEPTSKRGTVLLIR